MPALITQDKLWGVESLTRGEGFALVCLVPVWSFSGEVLGERRISFGGAYLGVLASFPIPAWPLRHRGSSCPCARRVDISALRLCQKPQSQSELGIL